MCQQAILVANYTANHQQIGIFFVIVLPSQHDLDVLVWIVNLDLLVDTNCVLVLHIHHAFRRAVCNVGTTKQLSYVVRPPGVHGAHILNAELVADILFPVENFATRQHDAF